VSRERLEAMLDYEWNQLLKQLQKTRGSQTRFFSFVNTVSASNYAGTNEPHGWVGLRFQLQPGGHPNDIVLHINLRDSSNLLQQQAVGMLGVNLVYAAFHQMEARESFLQGVAQDLEKRIEIDYVDLRGPAFEMWDSRAFLVHLVQAGLAEAVYFPCAALPVPPGEVLHKKAVVLAPGYFEHVDPIHAKIHEQLMSSAIEQLRGELGEAKSAPTGFFCLPATPFKSEEPPEISNLLARVDALRARGGNVLVFREHELYAMTTFVNRYTKEPVRFVVGLSAMIRAFEDRYKRLAGRFLDALSRLLAENVRIYAYPMTSKDLQEAIENLSATGWEWSETNGWVSAEQLRLAPPLGHLYAYILASNFLVPMQIPAALRAA
jgi:phage gpG-like protein